MASGGFPEPLASLVPLFYATEHELVRLQLPPAERRGPKGFREDSRDDRDWGKDLDNIYTASFGLCVCLRRCHGGSRRLMIKVKMPGPQSHITRLEGSSWLRNQDVKLSRNAEDEKLDNAQKLAPCTLVETTHTLSVYSYQVPHMPSARLPYDQE